MTPYYAGKGSGKRAFQSRGHGALHHPKDISRILVFPHATEAEAFESEMAFIKWFGRKDNGTGVLRNLTDGGEGVSGGHWEMSAEGRTNISTSLLGNTRTLGFKQSDETRAKLSAVQKASWASGTRPPVSEKELARLRVLGVGRKPSLETRAKLSAARLGRKLPPEWCANIAVGLIGKSPSLETRAKMSVAKLGRKRAPFTLETRLKMSIARRTRVKKPKF